MKNSFTSEAVAALNGAELSIETPGRGLQDCRIASHPSNYSGKHTPFFSVTEEENIPLLLINKRRRKKLDGVASLIADPTPLKLHQ